MVNIYVLTLSLTTFVRHRGIQIVLDGAAFGHSVTSVTTTQFEISGQCINPSQCDLWLAFGSDQQYITMGVALDGGINVGYTTGDIFIYPSNSVGLAYGNISTLLRGVTGTGNNFHYSMADELAGGSDSNWVRLSTEDSYDEWPLFLTVVSDAQAGTTTFSWTTPMTRMCFILVCRNVGRTE